MRIIALSGSARHGKDTAALYIKEALEARGKRVLVTHYADLLKYICKTFLGWNGEKDKLGRSMLQRVGTDIVRKKKPDFWVKFIADVLDLFKNQWDYVVIADARFPNEIHYLRKKGYEVIHALVLRTQFESPLTSEQQAHASETALDHISPDYMLLNTTLDEFQKAINTFVSDIFSGKIAGLKPEQISFFENQEGV